MRAIIFDVGGTLLREHPLLDDEEACLLRTERLREAFGEPCGWFNDLARHFASDRRTDPTHRQDSRAQVREYLQTVGVDIDERQAELVRAACCLPGPLMEAMNDGALDALRDAKRRGLRVALCSNVFWRTGADSRRDWIARGAGDLIDAYITSIDVGWLKPHRAMFEAALRAIDATPDGSVMIGDSGMKDIGPARRLGMRAIQMRADDRTTAEPPADLVIDSLRELPQALDRLAAA